MAQLEIVYCIISPYSPSLIPNNVGNPIINLPFGDGWNPTRKDGDDLGMVDCIGFPTSLVMFVGL
jgi:hypothetical protein